MTHPLAESYAYCRRLTRRTAGNFGYAFWALPIEERRAMDALYAFLRLTDDIGDEPTCDLPTRQRQLDAWRHDLQSALGGACVDHPVWPAVVDVVQRYDIPPRHLATVIEGVAMDLVPRPFETFCQLSDYCYHVAGAVGLCCIRIWGCRDANAEPYAVDCGLAFQLTNILRDLGEDAAQGRIYLPLEDLRRFGYTVEDLSARRTSREFRHLMAFEAERAWSCYRSSARLLDYLSPAGCKVLQIMRKIYAGLLREIERREFDVFSRRVRLPTWRKLWITGSTIWGSEGGGHALERTS
jgi:phytoene synthase